MATYPTGPISFSEIADALGVNRASGVSVTNLLSKLPAGGTTSFNTLRNAAKGIQLTPNSWYIPSRANSIGSTSALNITNVRYMTLTFWMYIGVTTTEWRSVLHFCPLNTDNRRPAMWITNLGSTGFHIRNDTSVSLNDGIWDTATVSPNPMAMKFFMAITWNNRTMNVYRNGQLLQSFTYSGDLLQPDSTYNIYSSTEFGYPITGGFKMANVRYYPSTLGASKILELYNNEKNVISDDTTFPDVTLVNETQLRTTLSAGTLIGGITSNTTLYSQNNWVRLTSATTGVFGMLYFYEILGSYWTCQFDFFNDAAGDAIWFAAYMTTAPSASTFMTESTVASNGGGYRFVADDFEQSYQLHGPQANGVSGPVQNDGNYIAHAASGNISNSIWRTMRIEFQQLSPTTNNIRIYINNVLTISTDHTPPNGYNVSHNTPCYFGFGARTGGAFGAHYVRNMTVTREIQSASTGLRFYHPDGRTVKVDGSTLRLNTGSEVTFDIYAGSDVYQSSYNRIAFFANGNSATSMRHAGLVIYLNPYTSNNFDWAWFIVRTADNCVRLYNDYGGYFLGYDASSDSLMIVPSNDSRIVDWRVSPMTHPMYTNYTTYFWPITSTTLAYTIDTASSEPIWGVPTPDPNTRWMWRDAAWNPSDGLYSHFQVSYTNTTGSNISATLYYLADNYIKVSCNKVLLTGYVAGGTPNWATPFSSSITLVPGRNIIEFVAYNIGGPGAMMYCVQVGGTTIMRSDNVGILFPNSSRLYVAGASGSDITIT